MAGNFLRVAVFGFVVLVMIALASILTDVITGFIGIGGVFGMVLSWGLLSILGGFLILRVALRFR